MFSIGLDIANADPVGRDDAADFIVKPKGLGLGEDCIIGGGSGPSYRRIDLRALSHPVDIQWVSNDSGIITDGADSIVFQGIEAILLPACMRANDPVPTDILPFRG